MHFGLTDDRFEKIQAVIKQIGSIDEVIIFGSRALGNYKPASDIDLALKGKDIPHRDMLKLKLMLEELPYGFEFDILDCSHISNPALLRHIEDAGMLFYRKS